VLDEEGKRGLLAEQFYVVHVCLVAENGLGVEAPRLGDILVHVEGGAAFAQSFKQEGKMDVAILHDEKCPVRCYADVEGLDELYFVPVVFYQVYGLPDTGKGGQGRKDAAVHNGGAGFFGLHKGLYFVGYLYPGLADDSVRHRKNNKGRKEMGCPIKYDYSRYLTTGP